MFGLNEDGGLCFIVTIVLSSLAFAAVALRLISNGVTNNKTHSDTVWIVVSLIGLFGHSLSLLWGIVMSRGALDESEIQINPSRSRWFIESTILTFELFVFTNTAVKISAILLYRRLFPTKRFLQLSHLTLAAVVIWWVIISIQWGLICQPLTLFWSESLINSLSSDGSLEADAASHLHGFCNSPNALLFVGDMVNILLDHIVLFMPVIPVYKLQLPVTQRFGLLALFSVGTFSCVSALVRLIIMFKPHRFYPGLAEGQIWSSVHLSTAIIYACIPSYRPLAMKLMDQSRRYFSRQSSSRPSRGVTPLVRKDSQPSRGATPISPAAEVAGSEDWPITVWATPYSLRAGAISPILKDQK